MVIGIAKLQKLSLQKVQKTAGNFGLETTP
jgi:hypothetical protein